MYFVDSEKRVQPYMEGLPMAVELIDGGGAVKSHRLKALPLIAAAALLFVFAGGLLQAQTLTSSAATGRDLFTGHARFQNGGPACIVCHATAGVGFPNGGTLGPNLSGLYNKLGPVGAKAVFETLYFPAMVPIYSRHPLTANEQGDLLAFFQATANVPHPADTTGMILIVAIIGAIIFILLTAFFWRERVLGVRANMVRMATETLRQR